MHIDPIWAPVVAGLGGGLVTAFAVLGVEWSRHRHERNERKRTERKEAFGQLLATSGVILHTASALHLAMQIRSGLSEGVEVTLGTRRPVDPLELDDRLRRDLEPLYRAWSSIWAYGSAPAVSAANRVINCCGEVMDAATTRGKARVGIVRALLGEKWTAEQLEAWKLSQRALAQARKELADIARRELGVEGAELFSNEAGR